MPNCDSLCIMPQKIALLGGTFDPIHIAHLSLANWVYHNLALDQLIFVPAAIPPHKQDKPVTAFDKRLEMLELAIADRPEFQVSTLERERTGPSYTFDTLHIFKQNHPQVQIWWIIGLDSLYKINSWYRYQEIPDYARLAVLPRPGKQSDQWPQVQAYIKSHLPGYVNAVDWIEMPRLAISSTEIRNWCQEGQNCRYLTPDSVWQYIQQHGLYFSV